MRITSLFAVPVLLCVCTGALCESPASKPATTRSAVAPDPSTPRGALKALDKSLPAGGLRAARAIYYAADANERKVIPSMAKADLATVELARAVAVKFGPKAAEDALHAMRQYTPADIDAAEEYVEGDKATIDWGDDREPLDMVKINGRWKIPVSPLFDQADTKAEDLIEGNELLAKELEATAKELAAGEYANAFLLERAIKQRMYRIMGDEDDNDGE